MNADEWFDAEELLELEQSDADLWEGLARKVNIDPKTNRAQDYIAVEREFYREIGQLVATEDIVARYATSGRERQRQGLRQARRNQGDRSLSTVSTTYHRLSKALGRMPTLAEVATNSQVKTKLGRTKTLSTSTVSRLRARLIRHGLLPPSD